MEPCEEITPQKSEKRKFHAPFLFLTLNPTLHSAPVPYDTLTGPTSLLGLRTSCPKRLPGQGFIRFLVASVQSDLNVYVFSAYIADWHPLSLHKQTSLVPSGPWSSKLVRWVRMRTAIEIGLLGIARNRLRAEHICVDCIVDPVGPCAKPVKRVLPLCGALTWKWN